MDVRQFLAQFDEGEITVEEVGRGMHVSFLNARSLVEDAELLLERRPARALSLAVLAMEETAKIFTLCTAAAMAYDGSVEWARARRKLDLLSHEAKQAVFAGYASAPRDALGQGTRHVLRVRGSRGSHPSAEPLQADGILRGLLQG